MLKRNFSKLSLSLCLVMGMSFSPSLYADKASTPDKEARKQHGMFSWNELMTTDIAAAKKFYGSLFGWTFKDEKVEVGGIKSYTTIKVGKEEVGGIMIIPQHAKKKNVPPHWGSYVMVDNVDATAKQAQKLGAKIYVPPTDIPDGLRFCVFQDPQGAVISIVSSKKDKK